MPGVTVMPSSPGLGSFGSSHSTTPNGTGKYYDNMSAQDIREKAKEAVQRETRGATPMTLIRTARTQYFTGRDNEDRGDLKGALAAFIKSLSLAKLAIDSPENGRGGVLRKEINEFLQEYGNELSARVTHVETKLKSFEESQPSSAPGNSNVGGTIADRLKALQDNGLSVGTSKRLSKNITEPNSSTLPKPSLSQLASPPNTLSTLLPSAPVSAVPSPHTIVPPSSFGPPSPPSTPSSPSLKTYNLSEFAQAFPSIEELDENPKYSLPSVPATAVPAVGSNGTGNDEPYVSPVPSFRNFTVPIDRPSSTPITPVVDAFSSRPASPTKSPTIPKAKATGVPPMSNNKQPNAKPLIPVSKVTSPKELANYIGVHNVLLLDVRNRADFEREHIKASAIACIEPSVLQRRDLTVERLEESMLIAPKQEQGLFANRDKFDLIVVYDEFSTSYGTSDSPLSVLIRLIGDKTVYRMLKRMPMLLLGGMEAWRRDIGSSGLVRGVSSTDPHRNPYLDDRAPSLSPSLSSASKNPFLINGSSPLQSPPLNDANYSWASRTRSDTNTPIFSPTLPSSEHHTYHSLDQSPNHSRSPAEVSYTNNIPISSNLARRPALSRPVSNSISFTRSIDNFSSPNLVSIPPNASGITYPQFSRQVSPSTTGSGSLPPLTHFDIASPPQASINPSQKSRRRSDFVDVSQEAYSGYNARTPIDYPELSSSQILRPPPAAASSTLERQDNRPRLQPTSLSFPSAPKAPRISSDYPVTYWFDIQIGTSGLKNLGNTCYMNAPIQCLSATVPFARFFTEGRWKNAVNYTNPLGSKGLLTGAFAKLLHDMWGGDLPYLTPIDFRKSICQLKTQYHGNDQHDSQEFLSFLLDGIHEDLNRIMVKPVWSPTPEQEAELERLPLQVASDQEWRTWRARNDSLIVDYFQGQFRNRLECLTCHVTSTTYNVFSILQVPIPQGKTGKVSLQNCLEAFFNMEILEGDDAWDCPKCKIKRTASKKLSIARLPPVLLIHLKRFEVNGRFSDKIDTFVDYPMKSLDLTGFIPTASSQDIEIIKSNDDLPASLEDPRTQVPPYQYDLYGVTNHFGNLSSGHYTASIASRGGWMYCDDSSIKSMDPKQVVSPRAYVLFYKRTKT